MPKTKRNVPCPCGSGKKYKRCCINKKSHNNHYENGQQKTLSLAKSFGKYNKLKLVTHLAALHLMPDNHYQTLRIECAVQTALFSSNNPKRTALKNIPTIIKKHLPTLGAIGIKEDPPENLFTDNINFFEDNYVVLNGISSQSAFLIRSMLASIFLYHEYHSIPTTFIAEINGATKLLLTISNLASVTAGNWRYMSSPNRHREDIVFPEVKEWLELSKSVVFTKEELVAFFDTEESFLRTIGYFTIYPTDASLSNAWLDENPLLLRPIAKIDEHYVLAAPHSILTTLSDFILKKAIEYNCLTDLIKYSKEFTWANIIRGTIEMGYIPLNLKLPANEYDAYSKDLCFEIDEDKVAYIQLIVDSGQNYGKNPTTDFWATTYEMGNLEKRKDAVFDFLEKNNFGDKKILSIRIVAGLGRTSFYIEPDNHKEHLQITLSINEWFPIALSGKFDKLGLWKFIEEFEKFQQRTKISHLNTKLDWVSFYLDKGHTFYINDKAIPDFVDLEFGYGTKLKEEIALKSDSHTIAYKNGSIVVKKLWTDLGAKVYYPIGSINPRLKLVIKGYKQPIWVRSSVNIQQLKDSLALTYLEINETLAYWLWQLTPSLKQHLSPVNSRLLIIYFDLLNSDKWGDRMQLGEKDPNILHLFQGEFSENGIRISIPYQIQSYLNSPNNEGERMLLRYLLKLFGDVMTRNNLENTLDIVTIEQILDRHAPLGRKKKFFIYDTKNDLRLDPRSLPIKRVIQEHDMEVEHALIISELGDKCPPVGKELSKSEQNQLCKDIVGVKYQKIVSILNQFDRKDLISYFINLGESCIYKNCKNGLIAPSRVACFTGFDTHLKELYEQTQNINKTTVNTRTILEMVAAIQPTGSKEMNTDDMDEILAISNSISNWANFGNGVEYELYNLGISVLPSERIGTKKEEIANYQKPFFEEHTKETLENTILNYKNNFSSVESVNQVNKEDIVLEEEINDAFVEEYGVSSVELGNIIYELHYIALYENSTSVGCLELETLAEKVSEKTAVSIENVHITLRRLALEKRVDYLKPPNAPRGHTKFKKNDINPWQYNRRLSIARKPIIIVNEGEKEIAYWGARMVISSWYYILENTNAGSLSVGSKKMKKLLHTIQTSKGTPFVQSIYDWMLDNLDDEVFIIDKEVDIDKGKKLDSDENHGDVDILLIDKQSKIIFFLECKNVRYARTAMEVYHELLKFQDNWMIKHSKRVEWGILNLKKIGDVYGLDLTDYSIQPFIVTPNQMPLQFFKKYNLLMPIQSFHRIKNDGMSALNTST